MLPGHGSDKEHGMKELFSTEYQLMPLFNEGKEDGTMGRMGAVGNASGRSF